MNRSFKFHLNNKVIFSILYLYFLITSFLIIPAGDDFFWWGKPGHYLLTHHFYGLDSSFGGSSNGRYLGNLLEILIMHSSIFAAIFYAGIITIFIWCLWYLTGRTRVSLTMALAFFITLQSGYIQSIFMWFAGFVNYLPPITLLLLYCIMFKKYIKTNYSSPTAFFFLMSFIGGLFVEHMTLYQIFVGLLSIYFLKIWNKRKNNNLSKNIVYAYTLGAVSSAIFMFVNPAYYFSRNEYRKVSFSLDKYFESYVNTTHFWIITFNYFIITLICLSLIVIALKEVKSKRIQYFIIISAVFFIIYYLSVNLYLKLNCKINYINYQFFQVNHKLALIDGLFGILFYLFLIASTLLVLKNYDTYFYLFSTVALFIPFLFILSPIFIREYFSSFVFLYILGIIYVNKAIAIIDMTTLTHKIFKIIMSGIVLSYALVMFMMIANYQSNMNRVKDPDFLYTAKTLEHKVPYPAFVSQNDELMMQSPVYWDNRLNYKLNDYFYNGNYK